VEISVIQKSSNKVIGASRPLVLFSYSSDGPLPSPPKGGDDDDDPIDQEHMVVSIDPSAIDELTACLEAASGKDSEAVRSIFVPLLFRRVEQYEDADLIVKYSSSQSHPYYRTLTVPLHFHHTGGLQVGL